MPAEAGAGPRKAWNMPAVTAKSHKISSSRPAMLSGLGLVKLWCKGRDARAATLHARMRDSCERLRRRPLHHLRPSPSTLTFDVWRGREEKIRCEKQRCRLGGRISRSLPSLVRQACQRRLSAARNAVLHEVKQIEAARASRADPIGWYRVLPELRELAGLRSF